MLTEIEQQEIERAIHPGEPRRMAVGDALNIVQKRNGWVSDEQVQKIADLLHMTPAEVDSIATFYNMIFRRPVGRHVLCICDSVSCHIMEYKAIHEYLQSRLGISLGQTTPDNLITYLPCACLGHCEQAPAIMVDGQVVGLVTPKKIDTILEDFGWKGP
jgi:NADH-quinone oxidoreductase subunit E